MFTGKKLTALILCAMLAAQMAACGGTDTPSGTSDTTAAAGDDTTAAAEYQYPYPTTGFGGEEFADGRRECGFGNAFCFHRYSSNLFRSFFRLRWTIVPTLVGERPRRSAISVFFQP